MTALWILLGIAVFIALLLSCSLTAYVHITDEIRFWIGAFGFRYSLDFDGEAVKKPKKKKRPKPKEGQKQPEQPKPKPEAKSFHDTVDSAIGLVRSILPNTIKMSKHIRMTAVSIDMTVAADSADSTAIEYGAVSGGVYTLLGSLDSLITLRVKSVDIRPDFVSGESRYHITFKVKLRFWHILHAAFGIIFKLIGNTNAAARRKPAASTPNGQPKEALAKKQQ